MKNRYFLTCAPAFLQKKKGSVNAVFVFCLILLSRLLYGGSAAAQVPAGPSAVECYTRYDTTTARSIVVPGKSCAQYPEYSPQAYDELNLPAIPLKTVRIMFHVFQKDDGTGNWQMPDQDGGIDENILRGLVNGLLEYPAGSGLYTRDIRGLNGIYGQLDQRTTTSNPGPNAHGTAVSGAMADTRIRFQLEGIRYYRNSYFWNMTPNNPQGCGNTCLTQYYRELITGSVAGQAFISNSGGPAMPAPALTLDQQKGIIHIFFGENPGLASTYVTPLGFPVTRYRTGGETASAPGTYLYCRGLYWTIKSNPDWAAGGVLNTDPHQAFKYAEYILAHELGHCMGLWHTYDNSDDCSTSYLDPPTTPLGENNNIMGSPYVPGFSFTKCQIGKMHYYLGYEGDAFLSPSNNLLDDALVPNYCQHDPNQDVHIKAGGTQEWRSAHNLQGNLYVEEGATLTVRCRVGFVGPQAKIVVRNGGRLILDNGTLGNYATSVRHECTQDLLLWLGGDGSDGDNSGLITIVNGGGFTSEHLNAVLTEGATLHIGPVPVLLDGSKLRTDANSYLCIEPGAALQYTQPASLTIDPNTVLGLNPAISLQANCQSDLCVLTAQLVRFAATTVYTASSGSTTVTSLCAGSSVTMSVFGPNINTVIWSKNGVQGPSSSQYTDIPVNATSGASLVTYSVEVTFTNGCPPMTWSFEQPLEPPGAIVLNKNTKTICSEGTTPEYTADGWLNLTGLTSYFYNPAANQNKAVAWYELPATVNGLLRIGLQSNNYELNMPEMRARGLTSYQLQLCNRNVGGRRCFVCETVTFTLQYGPSFIVPAPAPACPGQAVTLQAQGPAGTTYVWQPGNGAGASFTVTPTATTTYTVTGTAASGCATTKTVTVNVLRPTCLACLGSNNYTDMNLAGTSFTGFNFVAGKTYVFNQDTEFNTGTFVVPEGTRLLFEPNVTLTLRNNGRLDLRGGMLSATCAEMWGGIVAEASSGGVISQKPPTVAASEISHSRNGLVLSSSAPTLTQPALQLRYVNFLHNGQGVQVQASNTAGAPAFAGLIDHCLFDSDPRQMLTPWQYVSAQNLYVSQRHLFFAGNCAALTVQESTLDRALFGIWVPVAAPFTANHNVFRNMYIAGVYAHDAMSPNTHLTRNQFYFPSAAYPQPADNVTRSHSAQLQAAFATDLAAEGPISALREGACVGIYGPTTGTSANPFVLLGNDFIQTEPLTSYDTQFMSYPQHGVILNGGTAELRQNTFRNLHQAYLSSATQQGGNVRDNSFYNCGNGVRFVTTQYHTIPGTGDAIVSCNTFERPNNISGTSYNIGRDPCQAWTATDPCDQINISTTGALLGSPNILQKNLFIHPSVVLTGTDRVIDVANAATNGSIDYSTFTDVVSSVTIDGAVSVVDYGVQVVPPSSGNQGNNCASEGFNYGIQSRVAPQQTSGIKKQNLDKVFLAQNVPNPCSGITSVSYRTVSNVEAELVIRDYFSGAVVQRQVVPSGEHTIDLNVSKLRPGSYHYALEIGGRPVAHHNLMVQ